MKVVLDAYDAPPLLRMVARIAGWPFQWLGLKGDPAMRIQLEGTPYETVNVPADTAKLQKVYIVAPPNSDPAEAERSDVRIWIEDLTNGDRAYKDTIFNGRAN